jgi:hypothetical protein
VNLVTACAVDHISERLLPCMRWALRRYPRGTRYYATIVIPEECRSWILDQNMDWLLVRNWLDEFGVFGTDMNLLHAPETFREIRERSLGRFGLDSAQYLDLEEQPWLSPSAPTT